MIPAVEEVPMPPPPPRPEDLKRLVPSPYETVVLAKFRAPIRAQARRIFGAFFANGSCEDDIIQDLSIHVVRLCRSWQASGRAGPPDDQMVRATIRNARNNWRRGANRATSGRRVLVEKVTAEASAGYRNQTMIVAVTETDGPDQGDNRADAVRRLRVLREIDEDNVIDLLSTEGKIGTDLRRKLLKLRQRARAAGIDRE